MKTRDRDEAGSATASVDTDWLLAAYARMWDIRLFEEGMHRLFLKGEIHGTTHLSAGQEAVPVGVCAALEERDWAAGTYRGHGHALAKGTGLEPLAAEMLGRVDGVCGGRAGSMNVIDRAHRLVGCFGIVGGSAAAAIGAGLAAKREGGVSVAFFGDGATNHGYIHESVNFATVHSLPVVFVCENNLYGEFTPLSASTAGGDIAARIAPYGLPAVKVDGNDVVAVREAAATAAARARANSEPSFLECLTYRHYGHSKSDPGAYRTKEEVASWKERDPLRVGAERLLAEGVDAKTVDQVEAAARERVDAALARALESPFPDPVTDAATEFAA
jgi:TPP-dependent pyruvate/acetoin dehydrogenase alpha subunit